MPTYILEASMFFQKQKYFFFAILQILKINVFYIEFRVLHNTFRV